MSFWFRFTWAVNQSLVFGSWVCTNRGYTTSTSNSIKGLLQQAVSGQHNLIAPLLSKPFSGSGLSQQFSHLTNFMKMCKVLWSTDLLQPWTIGGETLRCIAHPFSAIPLGNGFKGFPLYSDWWFQIFFIFTPTWGNDPICLICFKWVETTN